MSIQIYFKSSIKFIKHLRLVDPVLINENDKSPVMIAEIRPKFFFKVDNSYWRKRSFLNPEVVWMDTCIKCKFVYIHYDFKFDNYIAEFYLK